MPFSKGELGIHIRRIVRFIDVSALVNFRLWGNVRLAVSPSATAPSPTMTTPLAMASAIITTTSLMWGLQGVNTLDQACILGIKAILGNGIREKVSHCLKI